MSRASTARKLSWPGYHPELDIVQKRQAKVNMNVPETPQQDPATIPLIFESPDSSSIASAEYDKDTGLMSIHFKRARGPERYDYAPVPFDLWARFTQAASKGVFFQSFIRPVYAGVKVERPK